MGHRGCAERGQSLRVRIEIAKELAHRGEARPLFGVLGWVARACLRSDEQADRESRGEDGEVASHESGLLPEG
jgi:hypothetical protein